MSTLKLEVVEGTDAGRWVVLDGPLEIGRDATAGLCLADKLVSRRHARIRIDTDGVVVEDLRSSNGTLVNNVPIKAPTRLAVGDTLLIGSSVLQLHAAHEPAQPGPAQPPAAETLAAAQGDEAVVGSTVAGHRILAVIARGGMGVVYRAQHLRLGRIVALKLLPPELAADEGFRERFECESRLAAAIDHPNIIPLYDAGMSDGMLFLTMRFVDGLDLKALLRRDGPLALDRATSIVAQVGGALDAAHARGLVHRDVKPANVLVASGAGPDSSDHCYLTDFGLTRDTAAEHRLTKPGEFVGTIDYAAPEQIQGDSTGGTADQYALGCVLYECLTGRPPFPHNRELEVLWAHLHEDPPAVRSRRPDLPRGIDDVLARAMAKAPDDRFESCAALASALKASRRGGRRSSSA